ncbi:MAG TPA: type III polyketide synthase [Longimicrobiales bacterium]|nr:type III polyketide synthase [Longimicrobiales bacterium]
MTLLIAGIGTATPEHSILQDEAAALHAAFSTTSERETRLLRALYRRTGVKSRHSVILDTSEGELERRQAFYPPSSGPDDGGPATATRMDKYERDAPALALAAAGRALDEAGVDAGTLTHLVTVSCTGFFSPGVDALVIDRLGLPATVQRTHVGFMGCHGTLNALRVASSFGTGHRDARVLVCSVELCSLHFAYGWHPERLVANALFADGAGALVGVSDGPAGPAPVAVAERGGAPWRVVASGGCLFPESAEAMSWRVGDHGFHMTLSARVPDLIAGQLQPWRCTWLGRHGLSVGDVGSWAVHPGGPRILEAVREALDLPEEATAVSQEVLAGHGNMSSATIVFILQRMRARGARLPCVAIAFGPGLVAEATLIA